MKDIAALSITVLAFAMLLTVHVAIAFGLVQRRPRLRALLAFVAFPLAPYLAWREGMKGRAGLWVASAIAYGVGRWLSR